MTNVFETKKLVHLQLYIRNFKNAVGNCFKFVFIYVAHLKTATRLTKVLNNTHDEKNKRKDKDKPHIHDRNSQ